MNKIVSIAVLILSFSLLNSCKKVEGEGGSSTIKGRIMVTNYNAGGTIVEGNYPGADQDVYIVYGEGNTVSNDRVKSSYDGTFEFKYLQKGDYTIYVYEDVLPELSSAAKEKVKLISAKIEDKKSIVDLGDINIQKK